ncbi:hypothetical protein DPMN_040072 [Dreissena polymorpha]|uniref:Uncharacterized protein n=1 Tax=Dreissena polymorpha TaxID=45954 RepID=A0A9D4CWF7_DREPO|nr:hypothetical protein DPMN_040072 [Dreissena polymorpha]
MEEVNSGFMKTIPCSPAPDGDYGVYALDCEMVGEALFWHHYWSNLMKDSFI